MRQQGATAERKPFQEVAEVLKSTPSMNWRLHADGEAGSRAGSKPGRNESTGECLQVAQAAWF